MVWSLSKDDDGLESVHPPTNQGAAGPLSRDRAPLGGPKPSGRTSSAAASVFVDPSSQVPDAATAFQRRDAVEPTVVLKGRKLDELRAQVAQQKLSHQHKKQKTLVIWTLAGGVALALGWLAGIFLSPQGAGQLRGSQGRTEPAAEQRAVEGRLVQEVSEEPRREELPSEEPLLQPTDAPVAERDKALTKEETSDTSTPSADEAFTLDDLPAE